MTGPALEPELERALESLAGVKSRAGSLTASLTEAQAGWSPGPGRWSILECLDHLNSTDAAYVNWINLALAGARSRGMLAEGPFRYGAFGRWFQSLLEPPPKHRFPAPKAFVPATRQLEIRPVVTDLERIHDALAECVHQAAGLDLRRVKVRSPATRLVHFRLGQVFDILTAHDRRHLWQAEQVRAHPDFPVK